MPRSSLKVHFDNHVLLLPTRRRKVWESFLLVVVSSFVFAIGAVRLQESIKPPDIPNEGFTVQANGRADREEITRYTQLNIQAGDIITVTAEGSIKLGTYSGEVDANGIDRGFMGLPIGNLRKRVSSFPNGALLCRIAGNNDWHECGTSQTFCATSSGILEFLINIKQQRNGFFNINIIDQPPGRSTLKCAREF